MGLSLVKIHKILLIAIILVSPAVCAEISLGTIQPEKSFSVDPGETAGFKILLFNTHASVHVRFSYEIPENWNIRIDPEELDVPSDSGEYISLPEGYVKASQIDIRVNVPDNEKAGDYAVKVIAQATSDESGTVSVSQERPFLFKVKVLGSARTDTKIQESSILSNLTEEPPAINKSLSQVYPEIEQQNQSTELNNTNQSEANGKGITGMVTANSVIWIIAVIAVVLLAIIYVKH
jgi:hypothetical protein